MFEYCEDNEKIKISKKIEEYIEVIMDLEDMDSVARTTEIAKKLNVKPASVTEMLNKLQDMGLVKYQQYKGAKLSRTGRNIGESLLRKHRLMANFLILMGVDEELANADACQIEHHISYISVNVLEDFMEFINRDDNYKNIWREFRKHMKKKGIYL